MRLTNILSPITNMNLFSQKKYAVATSKAQKIVSLLYDITWTCDDGKKILQLLLDKQANARENAVSRDDMLKHLFGRKYRALVREYNQTQTNANPSKAIQLRRKEIAYEIELLHRTLDGAISSLSYKLAQAESFLASTESDKLIVDSSKEYWNRFNKSYFIPGSKIDIDRVVQDLNNKISKLSSKRTAMSGTAAIVVN